MTSISLKSITALLIAFLLFSACNDDSIYNQKQDIPNNAWDATFQPEFKANVLDTTKVYEVVLHIRHATHYRHRNLWIEITTIFPDASSSVKKINLEMADEKGKWQGDCLGDICDLELVIQPQAIFPQQGDYLFRIKHLMRDDLVPFIMSLGLKIKSKSAV